MAKPGPTTLRYGGNTSCVELRSADGTLVVLDCGTGAHGLGQRLMASDEPLPPPPWHKAPRAARRRQLTRDTIVDAALAVLDREGLDAVSMRRVAQELQTGAALLYQHVGGKEELVALVFDRITGEIPIPPAPDPARWQEQLREAITDVWRGMTA